MKNLEFMRTLWSLYFIPLLTLDCFSRTTGKIHEVSFHNPVQPFDLFTHGVFFPVCQAKFSSLITLDTGRLLSPNNFFFLRLNNVIGLQLLFNSSLLIHCYLLKFIHMNFHPIHYSLSIQQFWLKIEWCCYYFRKTSSKVSSYFLA